MEPRTRKLSERRQLTVDLYQDEVDEQQLISNIDVAEEVAAPLDPSTNEDRPNLCKMISKSLLHSPASIHT